MIGGKQQILLEYIRSKKGHNIPASHVMQMLGMTQEELRAAVEAINAKRRRISLSPDGRTLTASYSNERS